jgi:hypothetical protein
VLGSPSVGFVGATGTVELPDTGLTGLTIDWEYHTDSWRAPTAQSARQTAVAGMPVVETRVAVPSGDVIHRVYATTDALVIEFENASPAPIAVSLGLPEERLDAAPRWRAVEQRDGSTVVVWPLPHRATVRAVVPASNPRVQPAADDVIRGWTAQLERGARIDVDDEMLQHAVDGARAALLLLTGRDRPRPGPDEAMALEDWGFDAEATAVWQRLSIRDRRRASRRAPLDDAWAIVRAELADAPGGVPARPGAFLRALREVMLRESGDAQATVALFPGFPAEWLGRAVAMHDIPTRHGAVSCAVRWHGARPALLWSAPAGVTLRAPLLDADWSSDTTEGEALLAEPPDQMLRLATAPREGDAVADPGSFT